MVPLGLVDAQIAVRRRLVAHELRRRLLPERLRDTDHRLDELSVEAGPGYSTAAKVPVSETRAIPLRLASVTTASATAGATSRLKALGMM